MQTNLIHELRELKTKLLYVTGLPEVKGTKIEETFFLFAENVDNIIELATENHQRIHPQNDIKD